MGWDGFSEDKDGLGRVLNDNSRGGKDAEEEVGAKDGLGRVLRGCRLHRPMLRG